MLPPHSIREGCWARETERASVDLFPGGEVLVVGFQGHGKIFCQTGRGEGTPAACSASTAWALLIHLRDP